MRAVGNAEDLFKDSIMPGDIQERMKPLGSKVSKGDFIIISLLFCVLLKSQKAYRPQRQILAAAQLRAAETNLANEPNKQLRAFHFSSKKATLEDPLLTVWRSIPQ